MSAAPAATRIWGRKDILPIAAFLALFLLLFGDFFFTGKTIFDRDVTLWEIPARKLCTQLLKDGGFALWTDAYGGGQPFLANLKTAAFYPAMLLYLGLPFFLAFKLYYFLHAVLTWTGTYFLGRSYALSRRASFLGASLFVFGGMYLSSFEFYNHIAALAWLPWILILLNLQLRRWFPRAVALSVLWSLSLLAGAPEITLITVVLGALQVLILARGTGRRLVLAAGSLAFALLLSAAQLIPSLELLTQSGRSSARFVEWSFEGVQSLNLPFANILGSDREPGHERYWAGHFFDRGYPLYYSLYIGLGALVLAFWALIGLRSRKILFMGASILVFLILASGRYSPLSTFFESLPLLSSIRYPVKFLMGSMFALCLLAAAGYDDAFKISQRQPRAGRTLGWFFAAAALLLGLLAQPVSRVLSSAFSITQARDAVEVRASLLAAAVLAGFLAPLALLSRRPGKTRRLASLLLVGIITLDLVYHNRHVNPLVSLALFESEDRALSAAAPLRLFREDDVPRPLRRGSTDILRLARYARQSVYPLTGIGDGVLYLYDKDTLDIYPREYRELCQSVEGRSSDERLKILKTEGCRYYAGHTRLTNLSAREINTTEGPLYVHELSAASFEARLVHDQIVAASTEERLRACLNVDFDPGRSVILDRPLVLGGPAAGAEKESLEILDSRQGMVRASAALSSDGIMVIPGNFARGWRARVDGRPAEVFRANLSSKGVGVPSGRHLVELEYQPASFRAGAGISVLSVLVLSVLVLVFALKRRPGVKPGCPEDGVSL